MEDERDGLGSKIFELKTAGGLEGSPIKNGAAALGSVGVEVDLVFSGSLSSAKQVYRILIKFKTRQTLMSCTL